MGRQIEKGKSIKNGGRKGRSLLVVFCTTFCIMLTVGMAGILTLRSLHEKDSASDRGQRKEKDVSLSLEKIPEGHKNYAGDGKTEEDAGEDGQPFSRDEGELEAEIYMTENRVLTGKGACQGQVTFGFAGDVLLDDEYAIMASLLQRGASIENGISQALLDQMRDVDVMVINNEFPFTDRGTPTEEKTFTFRADTAAVSYLHDMGVDAAVIANNHIYDFGEVGLLDTLEVLENAGIPGVGAGRNLEEASAPLYFVINDIKIALVAATQIERLENPDTKGATENSAGVFRCLNPAKLYEAVAEAKENSDFVIVYIHWGTEGELEPDWAQLDQGPGLAAAGADLIIGDHPHCLQGIDYLGDTPVIYSLGNFWFNSKTVDTGMVRVTITREGLKSFQFVPAIQSDCRVDLAYGHDKERILEDMRKLSPNAGIDREGYVYKAGEG